MKRNTFKWMVLGGALAIIVMYGLEMSTSGIERVYGPVESGERPYAEAQPKAADADASDAARSQQQRIEQLEKELRELKSLAGSSSEASAPEKEPEREASVTKPQPQAAEALPQENERLPGIPAGDDQPAVNRIADSTSGLLQNMSSEGIRLVVSIFDGLTK